MKVFCAIFLVSCLTTLITACSDSNSPTATNNGVTVQELFPMSIGNKWTYHYQEWNDDGSVNEDHPAEITVDSNSYLQNQSAFALTVFGKPTFLYYVGNSKLVNAKDTSYALVSGLNIGTEQLLEDTNAPVTVEAGTFTCYRFDDVTRIKNNAGGLDSNGIDSWYYGIGKGMIKEELVVFPQGKRHTFRIVGLVSYSVKK
jgi:hypothetical protein